MWIANFADGQTINARQRDWMLLPKFPIMSLLYQLRNGKFLYLAGFEKYWQTKEIYAFLYGAKGQKLWTWNICAKWGEDVFQFSHHITKNKYFYIQNKWGKEFRPLKIITLPAIIRPNKKPQKQYKIEFGVPKSTNHNEWHDGIKLEQCVVKIIG